VSANKIQISCPLCNYKFKPDTKKRLKVRLFSHLTLSSKHHLSREEAEKKIKVILKDDG